MPVDGVPHPLRMFTSPVAGTMRVGYLLVHLDRASAVIIVLNVTRWNLGVFLGPHLVGAI
jgi:hypothetical protein